MFCWKAKRPSGYTWATKNDYDIKNNARVTVNADFGVTSEAICQLFFSTDKVTSENHWQIASRVTPKSLFRVTNAFFLFLTRYLMSWTHNSATTSPLSLRRQSFIIQYCDVTTVDLWRHANVGHWHWDVIFIDCSCTRKLEQRGSSLVNNSREYRYLTTRYSLFSV